MSEGIIRINKVLRVNISLERAVDYLKIKGLLWKSKHKKFLMMYTMCLVQQFAGDR
jgi:hypothetical protein